MKGIVLVLTGIILCILSVYQQKSGCSDITFNATSIIAAIYVCSGVICIKLDDIKNKKN